MPKRFKIADYLLDVCKVPIDAFVCNKRKYTALHLAAARNEVEVVKYLLQKGADPRLKGFKNQ